MTVESEPQALSCTLEWVEGGEAREPCPALRIEGRLRPAGDFPALPRVGKANACRSQYAALSVGNNPLQRQCERGPRSECAKQADCVLLSHGGPGEDGRPEYLRWSR